MLLKKMGACLFLCSSLLFNVHPVDDPKNARSESGMPSSNAQKNLGEFFLTLLDQQKEQLETMKGALQGLSHNYNPGIIDLESRKFLQELIASDKKLLHFLSLLSKQQAHFITATEMGITGNMMITFLSHLISQGILAGVVLGFPNLQRSSSCFRALIASIVMSSTYFIGKEAWDVWRGQAELIKESGEEFRKFVNSLNLKDVQPTDPQYDCADSGECRRKTS